ncbi:hypothetical protein ACQEVS_13390 [Streptomyces sp. CA-181903]|uniref:hypothetical protein n=1 Tax=Streptomyces sp. CA-181903 TaxID=3240055 RepID=UPI003D92AF48
MTPETECTAKAAAVFLAGKKKSDDVAFMLERALAALGITVGDQDAWPRLTGRASLSGEPYVYLGTVPVATALKLVDTLVYAHSERRRRADALDARGGARDPRREPGTGCAP